MNLMRSIVSIHRLRDRDPMSSTTHGGGEKSSTATKLDRKAKGGISKSTQVKLFPVEYTNQTSIVTVKVHGHILCAL